MFSNKVYWQCSSIANNISPFNANNPIRQQQALPWDLLTVYNLPLKSIIVIWSLLRHTADEHFLCLPLTLMKEQKSHVILALQLFLG